MSVSVGHSGPVLGVGARFVRAGAGPSSVWTFGRDQAGRRPAGTGTPPRPRAVRPWTDGAGDGAAQLCERVVDLAVGWGGAAAGRRHRGAGRHGLPGWRR